MCSGRVDMKFVLRAFVQGMDGVFIGGCHLNECHYITDGNHHAMSMVQICRSLLRRIGIRPERLRMEELSAGEGIRFAEIMHDLSRRIREMGPLGRGEGEESDEGRRKFRLQAAYELVPYLRLVERERLRVRFNSAAEYEAFFSSKETERLLQELITDKLALCEIMMLLRAGTGSTREIAEFLSMTPAEVTRYLTAATRHGLASFDEHRKCFIAA